MSSGRSVGSSGGSGIVQGAMAPARLLILLLLVLQARDAWAAPWRAQGLALPVADGHPTSQPDLVREPQGDPTDMAVGGGDPASRLGSRADAEGNGVDVGRERAFPASRLHPARELSWHRRGPQKAKTKGERRKSSQRSSQVTKELLEELDKAARETDRGIVEQEALQEGGSQAVPGSDETTRAIQQIGVPALPNPGNARRAGMDDFLQKNPGGDGKRRTNATDANNFQKYCLEGAMAILGSILFGMVLCCAICLWRKRKKFRAEI